MTTQKGEKETENQEEDRGKMNTGSDRKWVGVFVHNSQKFCGLNPQGGSSEDWSTCLRSRHEKLC